MTLSRLKKSVSAPLQRSMAAKNPKLNKTTEAARNQCPCCMKRLWMLRAANLNFVGFTCPKCSVPLRVHLASRAQAMSGLFTVVFAVTACAILYLSPKEPLPSFDFDEARIHTWRLLSVGLFGILAVLSPMLIFPWLFGHLKRRNAR